MSASRKSQLPPCPVKGYEWVWPRKHLAKGDRYVWALATPGSLHGEHFRTDPVTGRLHSPVRRADMAYYGPKQSKVLCPTTLSYNGKFGGYIRRIAKRKKAAR